MGKARRKIYGIDAVNIFKKSSLLYFLEQLGADDMQSKLWYGDATIKQDLHVEGELFGTVSSDVLTEQAQDFKVHKDLVVQDDATVKDDLHVDDRLFIGGHIASQDGFWRDTGTLGILSSSHIEFYPGGTVNFYNHSVNFDSVGGLWILEDLKIQDDATLKNQITVEGQGTTYKGITADLTACGMKYRIVNGLIVEAVQK